MTSAMRYGIAGASLIALALGFFFSGRLSANLRALAHGIQSMRKGELRQIVARYGGEEFVIAFPETPLADAYATCERIRRRIAEHAWHDVQPGLAVTMTFGIDADISRARVEQLVDAADARLYEGKRAGRNRIVCEPTQQRA